MRRYGGDGWTRGLADWGECGVVDWEEVVCMGNVVSVLLILTCRRAHAVKLQRLERVGFQE